MSVVMQENVIPCSLVFFLQAEVARQYGARVYCVGVKDFDKDQVIKSSAKCSPAMNN